MKKWAILALLVIFAVSFYIRSVNIQPDMLVQFDPVFQLRMTQYIVDWGHLPVWDELTYYVGSAKTPTDSTFLWYLTAWLSLLLKPFGMSLMTSAEWLSAFYGAAIVVPAFLIGKEFSNENGGLMAAALIGSAPQIMIRTFGGSFDTDQLVIFFILLSIYAMMMMLKHRNVASFCFALTVTAAFALTWPMFIYAVAIIAGYIAAEFALSAAERRPDAKKLKGDAMLLAGMCAALTAIGFILKKNLLDNFTGLLGFVSKTESLIVNISIAELQPFNIFSLDGWMTAIGKFSVGNAAVDIAILAAFTLLIAAAVWIAWKEKSGGRPGLAFTLTLLAVGIYTTFKGIRFTEFSSLLLLCIVGIGFGRLTSYISGRSDMVKTIVTGVGFMMIFCALLIGVEMGSQLGPGDSAEWQDAWAFLKTTPELSVVGTWWDPGHMIAGTAGRRNIADGAHCSPGNCLYTINDRIIDLGLVMATDNETLSVELINKYKGDSPKQYWIASSDLIGKFHWCLYFGTGCEDCPNYMSIPQTGAVGGARQYGNVIVTGGTPVIIQNRVGILPKEALYYEGGAVKSSSPNSSAIDESSLGIRMGNQTSDYSVWIAEDESYIVLIPPSLREAVFTKMFMLEGNGLEHFKQVFRNSDVKIYEVT